MRWPTRLDLRFWMSQALHLSRHAVPCRVQLVCRQRYEVLGMEPSVAVVMEGFDDRRCF